MPKYFADEHDFKKFPELRNSDLGTIGFASPVVQMLDDFEAEVVKVHDGDTITVRVPERDFDFPIRLIGIDAPELNAGGEEARDYVKEWIEGSKVWIRIDPHNRVGKYGRLLGDVIADGLSVSETLMRLGYASPFEQRIEGRIPDLNKELRMEQWF